jgi:NAD(P)-dependent dehydrogenase (short-subunit alcohol dehydrogenase family)
MREERSLLVVGAGPGLGAAVCRRFAREGYALCGVRRRHGDALEALCKEIRERQAGAAPAPCSSHAMKSL